MTAGTDSLVVFARAPRRGTVKTRLAASLGDDEALRIYRGLAERTLQAAVESGLALTVAFTPADAGEEMRAWLGAGPRYEPQCEGDLGARMAASMASQLARGAGHVVVVGTDCPSLTAGTIRSALGALETSDAVFGPTPDGGYYLVALDAPHPELFASVPWSTDRTLAVTLERARNAGLRVTLLERLCDIDTGDDWRSWVAGSA